jgi:hypothetical protein
VLKSSLNLDKLTYSVPKPLHRDVVMSIGMSGLDSGWHGETTWECQRYGSDSIS